MNVKTKHLGVCVFQSGVFERLEKWKDFVVEPVKRGLVGVLAGTEIPQLEDRENSREREINERGKQGRKKKNRGGGEEERENSWSDKNVLEV